MGDSLPLGGLEPNILAWALTGTFAVLLPAWLFLLFWRAEEGRMPWRQVVLGAAVLGALLFVPSVAAGVSLLMPAKQVAAAKAPSDDLVQALPDKTVTAVPAITPTSQSPKSQATSTKDASGSTLPATATPAVSQAAPATATARPRATETAVPPATQGKTKDLAAQGLNIFERERCTACHSINGRGGTVGPDLAGVSVRRSPTWIMDHFKDPQTVSPGTLMPKFNLPSEDFEALTAYLLTLKR